MEITYNAVSASRLTYVETMDNNDFDNGYRRDSYITTESNLATTGVITGLTFHGANWWPTDHGSNTVWFPRATWTFAGFTTQTPSSSTITSLRYEVTVNITANSLNAGNTVAVRINNNTIGTITSGSTGSRTFISASTTVDQAYKDAFYLIYGKTWLPGNEQFTFDTELVGNQAQSDFLVVDYTVTGVRLVVTPSVESLNITSFSIEGGSLAGVNLGDVEVTRMDITQPLTFSTVRIYESAATTRPAWTYVNTLPDISDGWSPVATYTAPNIPSTIKSTIASARTAVYKHWLIISRDSAPYDVQFLTWTMPGVTPTSSIIVNPNTNILPEDGSVIAVEATVVGANETLDPLQFPTSLVNNTLRKTTGTRTITTDSGGKVTHQYNFNYTLVGGIFPRTVSIGASGWNDSVFTGLPLPATNVTFATFNTIQAAYISTATPVAYPSTMTFVMEAALPFAAPLDGSRPLAVPGVLTIRNNTSGVSRSYNFSSKTDQTATYNIATEAFMPGVCTITMLMETESKVMIDGVLTTIRTYRDSKTFQVTVSAPAVPVPSVYILETLTNNAPWNTITLPSVHVGDVVNLSLSKTNFTQPDVIWTYSTGSLVDNIDTAVATGGTSSATSFKWSPPPEAAVGSTHTLTVAGAAADSAATDTTQTFTIVATPARGGNNKSALASSN